MTITINLSPETEEKLLQRARASGQSVDGYVRHLVEKDVAEVNGGQTPGASSVEERFQQLADEWREAVAPFSSVTKIVQHSTYQQIISLGKDVVPLILRELERQPDHWFAALHVLTGADPVAAEDRGRMERMAVSWVRWGRAHGYTW